MLRSKFILLWPSETYCDAYTSAENVTCILVQHSLYRPCSCRDILFSFWEGNFQIFQISSLQLSDGCRKMLPNWLTFNFKIIFHVFGFKLHRLDRYWRMTKGSIDKLFSIQFVVNTTIVPLCFLPKASHFSFFRLSVPPIYSLLQWDDCAAQAVAWKPFQSLKWKNVSIWPWFHQTRI